MLARDLPRGLSICLLGALRDDLSPGAWTEHLQDDALWDALGSCDPWHDPFSLLGALDIALYRQHDERFQEFSEKAVIKLVGEKLPRGDGIDTYEWFPLLAEVVLNRIHRIEGGATRAPYWKRMCAWIQAGFLVQITSSLDLDFQQARKWMEANTSAAGLYANLLDLRHEPMVRACTISRQGLYDEVLGRLKALQSRHAGAGRTMPHTDEIDNAISQLADRGSPFGWVLPGPLEGHRRPVGISGRGLPDQIASHIVPRLLQDPTGPVWRVLAHLSQCFDIGNDVLEQTRRACLVKGDFEHELERLADAGVVASSQGDKELARSIASLVKERAPEARSGQDAVILLRVLVIASAAFDDEREWSQWLEEQLSDLAARIPTGKISETFLVHLREIKTVLPLTCRVVTCAEAMASAAS